MATKKLRVVAEGETATHRKKQTVSEAAASGDRLDLLLAMRTRVASAVADAETPARDLAALTRRLLEIAKDIEVLEAAAEQERRDNSASEDSAFDASAI